MPSHGPIPGWVEREPVQGDTPEARARFECERQGVPFAMPPEGMECIAAIIARAEEAKERTARLDREAERARAARQ